VNVLYSREGDNEMQIILYYVWSDENKSAVVFGGKF